MDVIATLGILLSATVFTTTIQAPDFEDIEGDPTDHGERPRVVDCHQMFAWKVDTNKTRLAPLTRFTRISQVAFKANSKVRLLK